MILRLKIGFLQIPMDLKIISPSIEMAINIVVKTNPCDILGFISHDIPLYPQLLLLFYTAILVGENLHFWAYPNQFLLVKIYMWKSIWSFYMAMEIRKITMFKNPI